jgi:hypothetical protein
LLSETSFRQKQRNQQHPFHETDFIVPSQWWNEPLSARLRALAVQYQYRTTTVRERLARNCQGPAGLTGYIHLEPANRRRIIKRRWRSYKARD